ncbi:response regulator transcription factor [Kutzneria sp. NPDC051319]|uniref:helix-turn-helix transcriptional regulator n=1 Tax=Kutzneria sp. NPDC051319 TaxID=3155047 RepID=UPI003430F0C2
MTIEMTPTVARKNLGTADVDARDHQISVMVCANDESRAAHVRAALTFSPNIRQLPHGQGPQADVLLVVADVVNEPLLDALDAMAAGAANPSQRVVLVTRMLPGRHLFRVLKTGVVSVLPTRDATDAAVVRAVEGAGRGTSMLPERLCRQLVDEVRVLMSSFEHQGLGPGGLTNREIEVLQMLSNGETTAVIAERMSYSERTIKKVIHDLMARLNLHSRAHAVSYAMRMGAI